MGILKDELRLGDILIFKAGNDWIGKSIAWLTKSDVSHAAMVYGEDKIVEMGLSGIKVTGISEDEKGAVTHILRLNPEVNSAPLINAASIYIDNQIKYDVPALVLLAGLLIYREIRPTPKLKIITDTIIRLACAEVDKIITGFRKDKKKTMVCSQLVYQCYHDCGKEYYIHIEDGSFQQNMVNDLQSVNTQVTGMPEIRLIDLLYNDNTPPISVAADQNDSLINTNDNSNQSLETLSKQLYEALADTTDTNTFDAAEDTNDLALSNILSGARKLLERLEDYLEESKIDIPLQALFVTPSDMLYHSTNLKKIGTYKINRA